MCSVRTLSRHPGTFILTSIVRALSIFVYPYIVNQPDLYTFLPGTGRRVELDEAYGTQSRTSHIDIKNKGSELPTIVIASVN